MKFNYQARTKEGEIQTGTVEAPSREAALNLLRKHGLYLTALEKIAARPIYARKIKIFQRTSRKDIVLFSRQLSIMFKSKVSLSETLRTLASQTKNPDFKEKLLTLVENVEGGTSLSQALKNYPKLFSPFYVAMVKSGEVSGNFSDVLNYLANHLEKEYHFLSKIRGAMIYPAMIVFVVLIVLALMMFFVIPNLMKLMEETQQELPFITKVVMGLSVFLKHWGWLVLAGLVGLIFLGLQYYKTSAGKKRLDRLVLRLPLIGDFLKMLYLSRFASNLSTLISGGLPIARALKITGNIIGNSVYKDIILKSQEGVRRGVPISSILEKYPQAFPAMFCQMTLVGEKTGTLDKTLMDVVSFYQKETDRRIDILLSILEPLLIIFLGLVVVGLMAAVLLPLYSMMSI